MPTAWPLWLLWLRLSSAEPVAVLYTMGSGDEILTRYGHAALCVRPDGAGDKTALTGICYDYGHTDYSDMGVVVWEFLRKKGRYWAESSQEARMLNRYRRQDQTIWRQDLPLTPAQITAMIADLIAATKGEKTRYFHHAYHDNCSTRIRDHIDRATGGALSRDAAGADAREPDDGPTFRDYTERGLADLPPLQAITAISLGRAADQPTSPWSRMFVPADLREAVAARLSAPPQQISRRAGPDPAESWWVGRAILAAAAATAAALTLLAARRRPGLALTTAGLLAGAPALIAWGGAALSNLPELRWNEVLLCLWPTDLLLGWMGRHARRYLQLRLGSLALIALLSAVGLLIQPLGPALLLAALPLGVTWRRLIATEASEPAPTPP